MPWRWLGILCIGLATIVKLHLIGLGPDLEPDAYGHALAARRMLQDPTDLAAHWVWLPVGHLLSATFLALGVGMDGMRYLNAGLTSALALAIGVAGDRTRQDFEDRALRWTTASIVALNPIALAAGETGVLEPLFALLVFASAISLRSGRMLLAGMLASCAALLRYEGWMLPVVFFAVWWRSGRGTKQALAWLAPASTIVAYVGLRAWIEGAALSFVRHNDAFARTFYADVAPHWPVPPHASWMSIWYALIVPCVVLGPLMPFALAGTPWLVRRGPRPLAGVLFAILLFLTAGFVARQHMGLLRHALTLIPLYAFAAAAGLLAAARALQRRIRSGRIEHERCAFVVVAGATLVFAASMALPTLIVRARLHAHAHRDDVAIARALQSVWSKRARVYCDVTPVETLSNVPPSAFVRWQLPDTQRANLEYDWTRGYDVLVVSTDARTRHLRSDLRPLDAAGELVLYRYAPAADVIARMRRW